MSAGRSRWRIARRAALSPIAAIAIFAGSSVAAVAAAPATAAAATPTYSLGNAATTVKTSNGVSWGLFVGWEQVISSEPPSLSVGLERLVTTGGMAAELHLWSFNVTASTLTFNTKTGTLNSGTQANPVASVDVAFKTTSSKKTTCTSGSETVYSGTLTGKVTLVTGLTGGGTVGGSSLSFKTAAPEITADSSCILPSGNTCTAAAIFSSGNFTGATPEASGGTLNLFGKTVSDVGLVRTTPLSAPKGASRTDLAALEGAKATYNSTTKVMSVATSTSGFVTGSATLSGGKVTSTSYSCSYKTTKYKVTSSVDTTAKYASPAGKAIRARTSLAGPMTAPLAYSPGFYEVDTVKVV